MILRDEIDTIIRKRPDAVWSAADTMFSAFHGTWQRAVVMAQPYGSFLTDEAYCEETYHRVLMATKTMLDEKIGRLQHLLDLQGISCYLPPLSQTDEIGLAAPFSFKYAAVQAGLGWIGKNGVLVTREFGPRVRLGVLLLDYPLACGTPVTTGSCGDCHVCVDACPWNLIKGTAWNISAKRDDLLDFRECNRKRSGYIASHGRKHECGHCILACPRGLRCPGVNSGIRPSPESDGRNGCKKRDCRIPEKTGRCD
jgi:epoxyqueuosine reductase QueG